tara:strand:+ start:29 stop:373 length:345 start_codon:yes stop_codon:yes gene_type:complete
MWGNAIFKPGIGSMCQARTCKKARYRGDSIDYWINNSYFCEEHAKNACTGQISFPGEKLKNLSSEQKAIAEFLRENLKLVNYVRGGCPEEGCLPDQDIFLVLDGEVISEINLDV